MSKDRFSSRRVGEAPRRTSRLIGVIVAGVLGLALAAPVAASQPAPADVSGTWSISFVDVVRMPPWVAQGIFGFAPEGPNTHAVCIGSATMTLSQVDATVSGTYVQTANQCLTRGGQVSQDESPPFSVEGEIHGSSLRVLLDGVDLDCHYNLVIFSSDEEVATGLSGGGRCIVPGHPKSDIPLDPPPAGTSLTRSFEAWRP